MAVSEKLSSVVEVLCEAFDNHLSYDDEASEYFEKGGKLRITFSEKDTIIEEIRK